MGEEYTVAMDGQGREIRGRGAEWNPPNRFIPLHVIPDPESGEEGPSPRTEFFEDHSRSIITTNDSPDVGFEASLNPYRGCEHGCSYCYARPYHEYLGLSAGLDFETKIMAKQDTPELLRKELSSPKWKPKVLSMSGITDCYQPVERKLQITRRCLQVLLEFRNPVSIITKNHLVTRDLDLLRELARFRAIAVCVSITTLDADLSGKLEPRASRPPLRLEAVRALREAGVPVGVNVAPIIPGLTDHEVPAILKAAAAAGAQSAGYTIVRLPYAVKDVFQAWLETHFPDRKKKILHRIREMRDGKLNDPNFFSRMRGKGIYAKQIHDLFAISRRRAGIPQSWPRLSTAHFCRPGETQLSLFKTQTFIFKR